MKNTSWKIAIISCILVFSCASNVKSKKFTDGDLDNYKTYAYLPETQMNASDFNRTANEAVNEGAVAAMKDRMNERGYSMNSSSPDLLVLISGSTGINSTLKKDGLNRGAAASSSAGSPYSANTGSSSSTRASKNSANSSRPSQTGNMTIEVFDGKTKELVWVGLVKNYETDIAATNVPASMVDAIFTKFPKN